MSGEGSIRVLHAIANLDVGGAQEVVRSLAPALNELGCRTAVATLRDGPLRAGLEADGVPVHVLPGRSRALVGDPRAVGELWRIRSEMAELARALRIDVLQTHLLRSLDFLVLGLRRGGRPRVVWTFHNARLDLRADQLPDGARFLRLKRKAYRSLYHHASRAAAGMVAVSSEVSASVRRDLRPAPGRLVTIPNGVAVERYMASARRTDVRSELGLPGDAILAICVAKLHEQKGHRALLEAFGRAAEREPRLHLALVGDGPLREPLAETIRAAGLGQRALMLGERRDIPELLSASDLFVLPSLWEGMPMALLEAMAAGLPVLASRVSGTEEVLAGGDAGVLIEPGDVPDLEDALLRVATDAELRSRLGRAARERVVERYSVEAQARAHLDLYRRCLAPRERRAA